MSTATDQLTLAEAAQFVPGRPHASTLWRWCRRGVKARNGERIRLAHSRYGSRVFVTAAAVQQFAAALATADLDHFTAPKPRSNSKRDRARAEQRHLGVTDPPVKHKGGLARD